MTQFLWRGSNLSYQKMPGMEPLTSQSSKEVVVDVKCVPHLEFSLAPMWNAKDVILFYVWIKRETAFICITLNYQGQRQMTEFSNVFRSSCTLLMNICCGHGNAMLLFYWRFWETVLITICRYWHFCDQYVFRTGITAILCERNQKIASVCTPVLLSCHSHSKNLLFQFGCWQAQGP